MTALKRLQIVSEFERYYWSKEPPGWAKDPFNDDAICQCGDCGAWMTVVRPGRVQCDACEWIGINRGEHPDA